MQPVLLSFCLGLVCLLTTSLAKQDDQWSVGKNLNKGFKHLNKGDSFQYKDCTGIRKAGYKESGAYLVWFNSTTPYTVVCNHTADGTFTVIQRRINGKVSFYRGWNDYVSGFGDPQGDFWVGLNSIHYSTLTGQNKMRVEMQDFNGNRRFIQYYKFIVNDAYDQYRLTIENGYGNVPDDLSFNNRFFFYTYDRPDPYNCAQNIKVGWWYNYCTLANPNGFYYNGPYTPTTGFYDGIFWKDWLGFGYSLKFITMTLYSDLS